MNEHFIEYNDILNRIKEIQLKLKLCRENIYSIKGVSYNDIPKGTNSGNDISYYLVEIEELENKLEKLKEKKDILRNEHEKEIEKVKDDRYRSILRMYYLDKVDIIRISEIMNLSVSHTRRLKSEAIAMFILQNDIK